MNWTLHRLEEFAALAPQWDRLNREGPDSPLLSSRFMLPLLAQFATGSEVLACGSVDGKPCAMLLLERHGRSVWQTFQPSQAPLGACVRHRDGDWLTALPALLRMLPGMATTLGVTQQDPELEARPVTTPVLQTLDYIRTARITLTGSFDDYWEARGKNLRQNLKKQRNKLDREGITTRLEILTAAQDVAQAVADYGTLESAGWKAEGGTAIHADNAQGRFYRAMLENFCGAGRGRIYRYWYNQRLAAMDLCIEGEDSIIILKTTYDEQVAAGTSPALLMRQEAVALLFAQERIRRIEFYGKVLDWHTKWSDEMRTMFHVTVFRWRLLLPLRTLLSTLLRPVLRGRGP